MKNKPLIVPILLALTLAPAGAAVRYVNLANPSPRCPSVGAHHHASKISKNLGSKVNNSSSSKTTNQPL